MQRLSPPAWVLSVCFLLAIGTASHAERPTAMELFPGETVLFLRTADARLMIERLEQTSVPQMLQDPALADFVGSLENSARELYAEEAEGELGIDFDRLLSLPQGEVAFALVDRREEDPAVLLLADFCDEVATAETLLEQAKEKTTQEGGLVGEEKIREDTVITLRSQNDSKNVLGVVQRDAVFVASNDPALLASVLDRWDGVTPVAEETSEETDPAEEPPAPRYTESLEKNRAFASSLRECLHGREEPPQMIAFLDPIGLVRATNYKNTGVRIGLATLPALGVDAIEGAAGAAWLATESWDVLLRGHLLVDNPRTGVMRIVRLSGGDMTPPLCVPEGVIHFTTAYVDPVQIFDDIEAVVDRFRYEGSFRELVKSQVSDNIGVDLPDELLPVLTGRVSILGAFEEGGQNTPNHTMVIAEVTDEEQARKLLERFLERRREEDRMVRNMTQQKLGEVTYYAVRREEGEGGDPRRRRPFSPSMGVFGGSVVVGTSEEVFKQMVEAQEGSRARLRDSLQYKMVGSRLKRLAGEHPIGVMIYENPEEQLRHWLGVASGEQADWFRNTEQPAMAALRNALEAGDLPPFEDLVKYAVPGGTVVYDTPTGFHYMEFAFRRTSE